MLQIDSLNFFSEGLIHGITQADEGDFNATKPGFEEVRTIFAKNNQLPNLPQHTMQVHSKKVIKIDSVDDPLQEGDALITNQTNIPLMVKTADCQPVIIYSPDVNALGVVHSGWRGSVQNIIGETIERMMNEYQAHSEKMWLGIGPSLGPCCSEFTDPKNELPEFCHPFVEDRHVNFWKLSLQQCQEKGIPLNQIELANHCTKCQPGYFSHRRGETQRFATWAMLF